MVGILVWFGSLVTAVMCRRFVPSCRVGAGPDCSSVGCVGRTKARHGRPDPRVEYRCHCRFVDVTEYFWISASHFQMMMDLPVVIPHRGYDRARGPDSRGSSLVTTRDIITSLGAAKGAARLCSASASPPLTDHCNLAMMRDRQTVPSNSVMDGQNGLKMGRDIYASPPQ